MKEKSMPKSIADIVAPVQDHIPNPVLIYPMVKQLIMSCRSLGTIVKCVIRQLLYKQKYEFNDV
jgi:hypothetical protein